jgi:hypothetical protein
LAPVRIDHLLDFSKEPKKYIGSIQEPSDQSGEDLVHLVAIQSADELHRELQRIK